MTQELVLNRMNFDWFMYRVDSEGLDAGWLGCLSHIFREVLRYHDAPSPLRILTRPLNLVFCVDKNRRIWLWDGPQEEFNAPLFNQGVSAAWRNEPTHEAAHTRMRTCLEEGKIPLIRLEWFHVPHSPYYHNGLWNRHLMAVLDYDTVNDKIFVLDHASRGKLDNYRGWIELRPLASAIDEGFGWLDYSISSPKEPWSVELRSIIRQSVDNMLNRKPQYSTFCSYGLEALNAMIWTLQKLSDEELALSRVQKMLQKHLPKCIRRFVVGTRRLLSAVLTDLEVEQPQTIALTLNQLIQVNEEWELLAVTLIDLGTEGTDLHRERAIRHLHHLIEMERELAHCLANVIDYTIPLELEREGELNVLSPTHAFHI